MDDNGDVPNTFSAPSNLFSTTDDIPEINSAGLNTFIAPHHSSSVAKELIETAQALVNPRGRGIYATDESPDVIEAAFVAAGKDRSQNEAEALKRRKEWREAAYNAVPAEHVSGVILYAETLLDFKLGHVLTKKGVIIGVRANGELAPLPASPFEFIVQGLDDLLAKLQAARAAGARFSKWRVPIACTSIGLGLPSQTSLDIQAETLAIYASISQQAGLVPIVEPDVEFSADADLARSVEVHQKAIRLIYDRCQSHNLAEALVGTLLKPSYPQPGLKHPSRSGVSSKEIALATASVIANSVPSAVAGVVFLSGGLSTPVALDYLSALNQLVNISPPTSPFKRLPPLSFSYGRALQGEAIKHWANKDTRSMKDSLERAAKGCWLAARGEPVQ
uniref:fructose-bisphosphate aldolase n=1 Tax=Moniliophthora roreri TaxID=221103 RepID=A0A0W0FUV3_MONRR